MNKKIFMSTALMAAMLCCGCNHLSSRAKEMIGNYYIPEISEDVPLMELNSDGTCTYRATNGILTISADGEWNVENDSLVIDLDPATVDTRGDSTLMGNVAAHISKYVIDFNGINLTLSDRGTQYVYHRRPQ